VNWLDAVILFIFLASAVAGYLRGFIKEAVSLASWVLAVWIAVRFSPALATLFPSSMSKVSFGIGQMQFHIDNLSVGIAMVGLFVVTLILGAVVNILLHRLIEVAKLSGTNRTLGVGFGLARGYLVVVALVLLAGLSSVPRQSYWSESLLTPHFESSAKWLLGILPDRISGYFNYK
jgi:membrane protein required for colicin V production